MNQNKLLLDLKCPPRWVRQSLCIISRSSNFRETWNKLVKMALTHGSTAKDDNLVSAIITPTLRNLRLIEGDGDQIRLTSDGSQCLKEYELNGELGFKRRLGYQVVLVDNLSVNLVGFLLTRHHSHQTAISVEALKRELSNEGIRNACKETPVRGWISFLVYVDLVRSVNSRYYVIQSQVKALKEGEGRPSWRQFKDALLAGARLLRVDLTAGSPYIPIPDLREHVSNKLGISSFTFDELIQEALSRRDIRIVLSTPMRKKSGGMTVRGKYYYFMALYTR
jgi:hypothetical protein